MVTKRNIYERLYGEKREFIYTFNHMPHPTIYELENACKLYLGLDQSEKVSIAKYVPHAFEWKWMNPNEEIVEK